MGEAKRRKSIQIEGPWSYEIGVYKLEDVFNGFVKARRGERPSERMAALMQATASLASRMGDQSLPTMMCAFCDYAFTRTERPSEIMLSLSWANPEHPPIISPICPACAAASEDVKTAMAKTSWAKLAPGSNFGGIGHG